MKLSTPKFHFLKKGGFFAFFVPFILMALIYLCIGIYPGSSRSILASDAFSQFSNFHASYRNMLSGKQGLFYSWNTSLGLNFYALAAYYLGGFLTPLVIFFPNQYMPDALYVLTLLKIGLAGLSFYFYARRFKLKTFPTVAFSTSYALMSFITVHSELIMWLDAFIYLPLIILGIEKLQDERKPALLFFSYLFAFTSNFYFGFMLGLFSFFYYFARLIINWAWAKKTVLLYFFTSLLAGGSSMIVILPTYLDLRTNGEALSTITKLKTEATAPLDLLMKNIIAVYDTTKYGSIPFIYIGLIPLSFCLFYFFTRKVPLKNKLAYLSLFVIISASFYLVPLNLFWHGMHAPNMFLFRYSFVFSFLVISLALRGFALFEKQDIFLISTIFVLLGLGFVLGRGLTGQHYNYISIWSLLLTVFFLLCYLAIFLLPHLKLLDKKIFLVVLSLFMITEATINAGGMIKGILGDWNYASRSLYTQPYPAIQQLVADSQEEKQFYRLENLDGVSSNDSFNYGYSGVSMFSSIRNRNSSHLLDQLGFRSRGTNLNIRYANNTLLMDNLIGMRYNISKTDPLKYGFQQVSVAGEYKLFQNQKVSSLGILTDAAVNNVSLPERDNLTSQENLINALAQTQENFYQLVEPEVTQTENTKIIENGNVVTYAEKTGNVSKDIHFKVTIPKGKQAYLSLYPMNYAELGSSTVSLLVNGQTQKSQININGQYYNLGNYAKETTLEFVASFYGSEKVTFMKPKVVLLDLASYDRAAEQLQKRSVPFTALKNGATAKFDLDSKQTLFTTIPYDLGWQAYLDGKKISVKSFKDAFVLLDLPAGKHTLELKFVPAGFKLGSLIALCSFSIFMGYLFFHNKKRKN